MKAQRGTPALAASRMTPTFASPQICSKIGTAVNQASHDRGQPQQQVCGERRFSPVAVHSTGCPATKVGLDVSMLMQGVAAAPQQQTRKLHPQPDLTQLGVRFWHCCLLHDYADHAKPCKDPAKTARSYLGTQDLVCRISCNRQQIIVCQAAACWQLVHQQTYANSAQHCYKTW